MKKKMLITGGSHAELPLIQAAQAAGWHVITTGMNQDGLGHKAANEYCPGDFSDPHYITQLARDLQVDAIVSGCNDFAYLSTAYACEQLGLPGHDSYATSQIIHHKDKFRQLLETLAIPSPRAIRCHSRDQLDELCSEIGFPIIIKPVDLTGGKGVKICPDLEAAHQAYDIAAEKTRMDYILVEEVIVGTNHGFSCLLRDQRVAFYFHDNEQYGLNPYLVAGASTPGDIPQSALDALVNYVENIAQHLHLVDGLFHLQFILRNGVPYIIDPCRRAPGDLYIQFVQEATGVDYAAAIVRAESGQSIADIQHQPIQGYYARECIMTDRTGVLEDIQYSPEIQGNIISQLIWGKPGDQIEDVLTYKAGIVFLKFANSGELQSKLDQFHHLIEIRFQA